MIPASHAWMSNPISQAVMKKSRPIKRAEAGVPTGKTKPLKQLEFFCKLHNESSGRRRQTFAALRQSCDIYSEGFESLLSHNIFF